MVRRLLVGVMAAGLLLVGAPAFAWPPVTTTTVQKNLVETFVDVIPTCEEGGPPIPSRSPATWSCTKPSSTTAACMRPSPRPAPLWPRR